MLLCGALPVMLGAQQSVGGDTAARPIGLHEAIRLAQRNAPVAVQARGQLRTSAASVRSSYGTFLPSASLSFGASRQFTGAGDRTFVNQNGERVTLAENWSYNNGLAFNVELFDGGRRFFNLGSARAGVDAAEANEVAQQYRVALDVKQQFYNVLAARESEAAARSQLEQAEQQLRAAAARAAAGAATKSDSLRSLIQVGNARLALVTARNALQVANASLTRLVASPILVTASPGDTGASAAAAADSISLARLAESGPAVRQAEANRAAARAARRAARTPYLPTVSASYSRSGSGADSRFGLGGDVACPTPANPGRRCPAYAYNGSLRFSLSYPIFNQFSREEQVVRADVAEDNAEAALRDARFLAQQNLVQFFGAMRSAEQRMAIQETSVLAAEEDLRVQQQRYAVGASTLLDMLTSQTQLTQARAALIAARYDYRVARAQIEAIVGREL